MHSLISFLLIFFAVPLKAANILGIFHYPSYSHQVVFQSLVKALSERGHELTILTADRMNSNHPNITEIFMENSYDININFVESRGLGGLQISYEVIKATILRVEQKLKQPKVRDLIVNHQNYHFDLLIIEYLFSTQMIAFGELYNCPIIGISSMDIGAPVHEMFGNSVNPAIHPELVLPYQPGRMTLLQRLSSSCLYLVTKFITKPMFEYFALRLVQKSFVNSTISVAELEDQIDLIFTNTNPVLDFIRPITPNTIQLGSMHLKPPKAITDQKLGKILDCSEQGVIFMSLGSNVKSRDLSEDTKNIFLNVFRTLPYQVLWKFEDDQLKNKSENVQISKWFPQSDLLAHPNVKMFIMQGGLMSLEEAIDRETPVIVIPFMFDQHKNALKAQEENFGLRLDIDDLTETKLLNAINEVTKPKYKENIKRFKQIMNDQPMKSLEKAVWWTEHVIRHKGAKHLKYPGRKVPFYQKTCLDLIALCFTVFYLIKKIGWLLKALKSDVKLKQD